MSAAPICRRGQASDVWHGALLEEAADEFVQLRVAVVWVNPS